MDTERLLTFVMTDVVGSVALWERDRLATARSIERLERLTDSLAEQFGGTVHKRRGEGDSFFLTFEQPLNAVRFSVAWTRAIQAQSWQNGIEIECRVGIRTGTAQARSGDYYGIAVNRCARMRALAGKSQVVMCDATLSLVRDDLPADCSHITFPEVRLRGVEHCEPIHLLCIDGVSASTALEYVQQPKHHNIPPRLTSFIGREQEREEIESMLRFHRLVTLVGPGGSGKTRLSEELSEALAEEMSDGAWFLALAECRSFDDMIATLHRELRPHFTFDSSDFGSVQTALACRHCLLLIDNCEHLAHEAARAIHAILTSCPHVRILATSRTPLGLPEEHIFQLEPFEIAGLDANLEQLNSSQAVRLFLERAKARDHRLELTEATAPHIARICLRLDGLALALEQAASHAGRLSVAQIGSRLGTSFSLLQNPVEGSDPRHETMMRTIQWSTELLDEVEAELFFRLPVFVGSWNIEAVEAIGRLLGLDSDAAMDALGALVDASLVQRFEQPEIGTRYRMLETVREFARSQQPIGDDSYDEHLLWCCQMAETADTELLGPNQAKWLRLLEWESGNIRQALNRALATSPNALVRLAASLKRYWIRTGLFHEGAQWLESALALGESAEPRLRAQILNALGACRWRLGEIEVAEGHYHQSLAIWKEIGDQAQIGALYTNLAICATDRKEFDAALQLYHDSCNAFRQCENPRGLGSALMNVGYLLVKLGRLDEARVQLLQSIEILENAGHVLDAAYAQGNLGWAEYDSATGWNRDSFLQHLIATIDTASRMRDSALFASIAQEAMARSISDDNSAAAAILIELFAKSLRLPKGSLKHSKTLLQDFLAVGHLKSSLQTKEDCESLAGYLRKAVELMATHRSGRTFSQGSVQETKQ